MKTTPTPRVEWSIRVEMRWCTLLALLTSLLLTGKPALARNPRGPDDMPDLCTGALEDHPIPPAPSGYLRHEVGWILFVYPREIRAQVEPLIESANDIRRAFRDDLGQTVLGHVEVRVAPSIEEMTSLAPGGLPPPSRTVGVAYARYRLVLLSAFSPEPGASSHLVQTYRHQLAHLALFDAVGGNALPVWFYEGYALHASQESSWARRRDLWSATVFDRLLPLSRLDEPASFRDEQEALARAQAADFVRFLSRTQEQDRFKELIARLDRGGPFYPTLQDSYGAPVRSLEHEWHDDLDSRYGRFPVFGVVGLLCLAALGFVGLRWSRRRHASHRPSPRDAPHTVPPRQPKKNRKTPAVRLTLTRSVVETVDLAALRREKTRDVPKIEHDGKWHTLH